MMLHETKTGLDPRGLIREAYAMENITEPECRSIFLDWALGHNEDPKTLIPGLIEQYAIHNNNHPMSKILTEGLQAIPSRRRRKGRSA